jgi:competence protein ComEA
MALYNREQLMVVCALLALGLCRAGWQALAPGEPAAAQSPRKQYVYEVAGAASRPGIYRYETPQLLEQLLEAAGAGDAQPAAAHPAGSVPNGSRITVDRQVRVELMSAQARINFFLPIGLAAATADDLSLIPGMGRITAQAIIDYRGKNGGIRDIGELKNVAGIGPRKCDLLAMYLTAEN